MTIQTETTTYRLNGETIDRIAEQVESFLTALGTERANIVRIRLSMEEVLLRWLDRFGTGAEVRFSTNINWTRPEIVLALRGEICNPLNMTESELDTWSNSLLSSIGITPRFNYHDGYNIIHLKLSRIRVNPAVALLLSGFIGIAGGAYLQLILTKEQLENLLILLHPVEEMFYRMLNAAAGPIIFLTVISAILSVGTLVSERKSGFRLIRRFLIMSSVITVVGLWILLFIPYFRIDNFEEQMRIKTFSDMMEMVFGIVPNDIITPFVNGDSPAIIFIALVTGNALLMAGSGSSLVVRVIEQADSVGLLLADWISSFSPWFITVLLVAGIGTNSVWEVLSVWKPLLAYTALSAVMLFAELLLVGGTVGMAPLRLWKKIRASFWIALLTGSVNEAYGANELCCRKRLGIPKKLTDFGLPIGLVTFMPAGTVALLIYTLHAAEYYHLTVTAEWYIRAVFMAVVLQAAGPPLPGVDLLAYAAMFHTLGIPDAALTGAVAADILFGFVTAAVDQAMLQLELVVEARRAGELNELVLKM